MSHFCDVKANDSIVDLGTGTGIIPLLLALNHDVKHIYGVEKQHEVAQMANRSVLTNNMQEKISIVESDIITILDTLKPSSADIVVSNPPYFKKGNALINHGGVKANSRHETTGELDDFVRIASKLLKTNGAFYMVHRPMRLVDIMVSCRKYNLEPKLIQFIYPHDEKPPNIVLIKCVKNGNGELKYLKNMYVYDEERDYTDAIKNVYRSLNIDVF